MLSRSNDFSRSKAVANGAISFYLDHYVAARVAKFTIGTDIVTKYTPSDPEHKKRSHLRYTDGLSGEVRLRNRFSVILEKVLKRYLISQI